VSDLIVDYQVLEQTEELMARLHQQILGRMQTLHTMSTQSRQAFQGTDAKLASELTKAHGTAEKG
jgi:hypothetical protein